MQIKIWIRPKADGTITLRIDPKHENYDTPKIHAWGHQLIQIIEQGVTSYEGGNK